MYNLHLATKIKKQLKKQRLSHLKQHQYVQNYANSIQPKLLDNYNKRINTFTRKMEENPIILKNFDQNQFAPHRLFRNFNQKQKCLGSQVFHFKDLNDWKSIYTQAQRSERKLNEKIMKDKFGDASLAYRSIISQSQYTASCKHEFRLRTKQKQINPPMKYICSVPKIMIRKLNNSNIKNKLRNKTQGIQDQYIKERKSLNLSKQVREKQNKSLVSKNSHSYHLIDEDNKSVRSFKSINSFAQSAISKNSSQVQENEENEEQKRQKQRKKYMSPKMHFKTLVETFQQSPDAKVKTNLRQILVKCGVFREKEKKVVSQIEIDKLSLQIDNHMTAQINNNNLYNGSSNANNSSKNYNNSNNINNINTLTNPLTYINNVSQHTNIDIINKEKGNNSQRSSKNNHNKKDQKESNRISKHLKN